MFDRCNDRIGCKVYPQCPDGCTGAASLSLEDKILTAIKYHGGKAATWVIANSIGMRGKTRQVLQVVKKMEKKGLVEKHKFSIPNSYVWMAVQAVRKEG